MTITPNLQVPLVLDAVRGSWANLCFDLHNLVEHAFHATPFRSLDLICIGSNCKLRKVFTLRAAPFENVGKETLNMPFSLWIANFPTTAETTVSDEGQRGTQYDHKEEIPRCHCFPASIDTPPLTMVRIACFCCLDFSFFNFTTNLTLERPSNN